MPDGDNAIFQSSKSEFAIMVKFLIKEMTENISDLEDALYMQPDATTEKRSTRIPYRKFRRVFREAFLLTQNTIRNRKTVKHIRNWFATAYKTETKISVFEEGIVLAQLFFDEMYDLGLLDLNVSPPVDFPFKDLIMDITAEAQRNSSMAVDITIAGSDSDPKLIDDEIRDRNSLFDVGERDLLDDDDLLEVGESIPDSRAEVDEGDI